jgi:EAL and modified HD-GYP domain-containing signal transduction protein
MPTAEKPATMDLKNGSICKGLIRNRVIGVAGLFPMGSPRKRAVRARSRRDRAQPWESFRWTPFEHLSTAADAVEKTARGAECSSTVVVLVWDELIDLPESPGAPDDTRAAQMPNFLIGRQQILDRNMNVFAYELLFRDANGQGPQFTEATEASNRVIVDSLLEGGLDRIVGPHRAFINFTRENLLCGTAKLLPKDRVVIEVLESVEVDHELVQAVRELARSGYMIALDDFVFSDAWLPLIQVAHIIKLDILQLTTETSLRYISSLKKMSVRFLAEKVETHDQYAAYRELGCDYFQGFLFSRPHIIRGRRVGAGQHAVMRLLAEINRANVTFDDLVQSISLDVGLSYKLLRYINNSVMFRLPRKVESIRRAVLCLGMREVRRWANLVALASFPKMPKELIVMSLVRARMCELLAASSSRDELDEFFLTGLMSMLEQLTNVELKDILSDLPLPEEVVRALLLREGPLGDALRCAVNYECWNLDAVGFAGLTMAEIGQVYRDAVAWANDAVSSLEV